MALVLVIDDDGVARDAFNAFLSRKGHEVLSAADGREGVALFREKAPDLVILDRNLPGLSGSGVFAAIRELSDSVPVLVVSGYDAPEDAERYIGMGAAGFLSKGDGLTPVLEAVDKILSGRAKPASPAGPVAAAGRAPLRDIALTALGLALASVALYLVADRGAPPVKEVPRVPSILPAAAGRQVSGPPAAEPAKEGRKPGKEALLRRAMDKYGDRPVAAEFLADLEKEPEAARALAGAVGKDPAAALSALKSEPGTYRLAVKYLARPDFISLITEVRRDPELAPLFSEGN